MTTMPNRFFIRMQVLGLITALLAPVAWAETAEETLDNETFGKLIIHTARDSENTILSRRFRDTRGLSSLKALRQRGIEADRLDGLVWSLCHGPYSPAISGLPAAERAAAFIAHLGDLSDRMFGQRP